MPRLPIPDRLSTLWSRTTRTTGAILLRDATAGLLLFAAALLPLGIRGLELGGLHHNVPAWLTVALSLGQTGSLALRRLRPATALLLVGLSFAATQLCGADTGLAGIGVLIAIYSFAVYQQTRRHRYITVAVLAYVALAVALHMAGSSETPIDWVTFLFVLSTPFFVGLLVRRRIAEQVIREQQAADRAVQAAKNELARDLHDIVTHHVTAIVIQADSAAYLDPDDEEERHATLASIGATGRRALQELRSLLGALEHTHVDGAQTTSTRSPVTTDLSALVEEILATGYPITLTQSGSPDITEVVAVTLYRVAQEATTNAMKHAPGEPIEIGLATHGDQVELTIENPASTTDPGPPGRGRRGMADRVKLLGGTAEIGVVNQRFRVRVLVDSRAEL